MILVGYNWVDVAEGVLWVSLILLALVIGYKQLMKKLSRSDFEPEDFCELYNLEEDPVSDELPFYFTASKVKEYTLSILDSNMDLVREIVTQECKEGGNIVRFDSKQLQNGNYFYCLKTDNQKVMKKMTVKNP
ncbi:MAG: hypothetical protein QNK23_10000 [Crocinitomicaceae bacterium]|nr:hypothetical protein [Crocinitomicaceae bacterium]